MVWAIYEATLLHDTRFTFKGRRPTSVFHSQRVTPTELKHPNEKPVDLMEQLVLAITDITDTVLDPFAGSGTTGVACKNLNRNFILIEKEHEYIDIINKRLSL